MINQDVHEQIVTTRGFSGEINTRHTRTLSKLISRVIGAQCRDRQFISGSEWAEKYRMMGDDSRYRKWRNARTPYLTEIADCISSDLFENRVIIVGKAAQLGASEMLLNEVLRRIHVDPCFILYYMETKEKIEQWSSKRLDPALMSDPFGAVSFRRAGLERRFPGGGLIMSGVGSAASMSSNPARLVIGDEVARYPVQIGKEGDFYSLARGRTKTYGPQSKIVLVSTFIGREEHEGSFYSLYTAGDRREYLCPCNECGDPYLWTMKRLREIDGEYAMECPTCGGFTRDGTERHDAILSGVWEATKERDISDITSFRVNGFVVNPEWKSWREFAEQYKAAESGKIAMQTYYNVELGEPFEEGVDRTPEPGEVEAKMKSFSYSVGEVPDDVVLLTMAADVQVDRLEWEIKGWTDNYTCYSIDRGTIHLEITYTDGIKEEIDAILDREYGGFRVWICVIDSTYRPEAVYDLVSKYPDYKKAQTGRHGSLVAYQGNKVAYNDRFLAQRPTDKTKRGQRRTRKHWTFGSDWAKRELYRTLLSSYELSESAEKKIGLVYAPAEYPGAYFAEIVAEQMVARVNPQTGKREIIFRQHRSKANEALDLHVMNRAALEILGIANERLMKVVARRAVRRRETLQTPETDIQSQKSKPVDPRMAERRARRTERQRQRRGRKSGS